MKPILAKLAARITALEHARSAADEMARPGLRVVVDSRDATDPADLQVRVDAAARAALAGRNGLVVARVIVDHETAHWGS